MVRTFLNFSLLLFFSHASLAECTINKDLLGAKYNVIISQADTDQQSPRELVLWRNGIQVAHEYKDNRITELWEQSRTGSLRLERHFDDYQRGIEYQPSEINNGRGVTDWSQKYQLVSKNLIASMQLDATHGEGCDKLEIYLLKRGDTSITLEWLPNQQLVKSFKEQNPSRTIVWELQETITGADEVRAAFSTRAAYQTTDYADIGDNESDPFFLKMMNLGFIAHGASGFYDADGHRLDGHHQHRH